MQTNYIIKQSVTPLVLLITFITSTVLQAEQQISYYQPRQAQYPQPKQSSSTASTILKAANNIAKIGLGLALVRLHHKGLTGTADIPRNIPVTTLLPFIPVDLPIPWYVGISGLIITIDGFRELYKLLFKRNEQEATPTTNALQAPAN